MGSNEELIRKGYEAFGAGDLATLETLFAPDVVWHEPGQSPISGTYKGWPELQGLFVAYAERSGGTFAAELLDTMGNDTHAISIARVRGSRNSVQLDQGDHLLCHVVDGRIVEARVLYHDQHAVDAFWA